MGVPTKNLYFSNINGRVGIQNTNPKNLLDIGGGLRLGDTTTTLNGNLRYNSLDQTFEGYDQNQWLSLTGLQGKASKIKSHISLVLIMLKVVHSPIIIVVLV